MVSLSRFTVVNLSHSITSSLSEKAAVGSCSTVYYYFSIYGNLASMVEYKPDFVMDHSLKLISNRANPIIDNLVGKLVARATVTPTK